MSSESGTPTEIVAVGRELVTGRTVDTNSAWLAARLGELGGAVTRIVAVDDDPAAVARELEGARARGAAVVVTTGGLGPTFDDCTLVGVAAALGVPVTEHAGALAFVGRRYRELTAAGALADATVTPARRKMAMLPAGAEPVDNPLGTAPGAIAGDAVFVVLSLPGVPSEMRAVFAEAVPALGRRLGVPRHTAEREVPSGLGDESLLTVAAERVMAAVPGVHVKSLATYFASDCDLRVRLTATAPDPADAEARVERAANALAAELVRLRAPA